LHGRTAFLTAGEGTTILHFFEVLDTQIFSRPAAVTTIGFVPGALRHIAFTLPDAAADLALRARLQALGIALPRGADLAFRPPRCGLLPDRYRLPLLRPPGRAWSRPGAAARCLSSARAI